MEEFTLERFIADLTQKICRSHNYRLSSATENEEEVSRALKA